MKEANRAGGFALAYRRRWDHPIFRNKREAAVWAWMTDIAMYEDRRIATKWGMVNLKRGQLIFSERKIAEEFGINRKRIRSLLQQMTMDGMLTLKRDHPTPNAGTIATIQNYDKYQELEPVPVEEGNHVGDLLGDHQGTTKGPPGDHLGTKIKETNEKKEDHTDASFEKFWVKYPSRKPHGNPKKPASQKFMALLKKGIAREEIIQGVENYALYVVRENVGPKFVAQAITWLNQERWKEYGEQPAASDGDGPWAGSL